jgi:hypothetical protein
MKGYKGERRTDAVPLLFLDVEMSREYSKPSLRPVRLSLYRERNLP